MNKMNKYLLFIICLHLLLGTNVSAQDTLKKIEEINISDEMSLEDLMNVKLTVASQKELTPWQTPAIITVFTSEDIAKMPSRDLVDIIGLIPGFQFGADIQGAIGVGVRGAWASEGKVLVLLDGMQMNENMYGTTQWLGHFDVNQIERIEVIRGPGYAYYNGFASLGVINIVTKTGEQLNGVKVAGMYGQLQNNFGHQLLSVQGGFKKNDLNVSIAAFGGQLKRFEGSYTDYSGNSTSLAEGANALGTPLQLRFSAEYKGLTLKYLHDDFRTSTRLFYGDLVAKPTSVDYFMRQVDIAYKWKINDKISLKPQFNVNYNRPWAASSIGDTIDPAFLYYDRRTVRYSAAIHLNYLINEKFQLNGGVGEYHDDAWATDATKASYAAYSVKPYYTTFYEYAELFFQHKNTTSSFGVRHENHNVAGNVVLPRLALTQKFGKFNLKGSFGRAFRSPLVENLAANPSIKPEITTVSELELAYKANDHLLFTTNVFSNEIRNVIVYGTVGLSDIYYNEKELDTKGVEAEVTYRRQGFYLTTNYSYYQNFHSYFKSYASPKESSLLGFANHKITMQGAYDFNESISLSTSAQFLTERYAVTAIDTAGDYVMTLLPASVLVNSALTFKNIKFLKGVELSVSCYNIFNSNFSYVQAYKGDLPPISGLGREYVLKLSYNFSTK